MSVPGAPPPRRQPGQAWMFTFADVLALLLTFFVMMYAMNDIREDEWQGFVTAMSDQFNPANPPADFQAQDGISDTSVYERRAMALDYLATLITEHLSDAGSAGAYRIERREAGLVINLPEVLIIQDGQPMLTPTAYAAARELGQILGTLGNEVSVAGHAVRGAEKGLYPSAWELSLAAAVLVADTLADAGYERDMLVLGHGDAYLKGSSTTPADSAATAPDSLSLSWGRVEIVVRDAQADASNVL